MKAEENDLDALENRLAIIGLPSGLFLADDPGDDADAASPNEQKIARWMNAIPDGNCRSREGRWGGIRESK